MKLKNVFKTLLSCFKKEKISILEFFERGFSLTKEDRFDKFDLSYAPWARVICQWFDDPKTVWAWLIMASQVSKTTIKMGVLQYVSRFIKGAVTVLWVGSTEEETEEFAKERLRPFLGEADKATFKTKEWKNTYFKYFNASIKLGWGSSEARCRSRPTKYIFCDEPSVYKVAVSYIKKRTRVFENAGRFGIFGTTLPKNPEHHSAKEAFAGDVFKWAVPCPVCNFFQILKLEQLKWKGKKETGDWDNDKIRETARYCCENCEAEWTESQKLEIINRGVAVCVDPKTNKPKKPKNGESKTLVISALYSPFTTWGQFAINFLDAVKEGIDALKTFYTDELAEIYEVKGTSFKKNKLIKLVDKNRKKGEIPPFIKALTLGIDVQGVGELYYTLLGWKPEKFFPSAHVVDYGVFNWKNLQGEPDFDPLLTYCAKYYDFLWHVCLDSSDGKETRKIYEFCRYYGLPFRAIKDDTKINSVWRASQIDKDPDGGKLEFGLEIMLVNSNSVKDQISECWSMPATLPGSWSFPCDTEEKYFTHLTNEKKVKEKRRNGEVEVWKPRYSGAKRDWFSSYVYGVAGIIPYRFQLQEVEKNVKEKVASKKQENNESNWLNYNNWKV